MKKSSLNSIANICMATLFILLTQNGKAQNIWKGGTIGKPSQWNVASNWSKNQVPDWSETVIIPDVRTQSGYFPVITEKVATIPRLEIYSDAQLFIFENGYLQINGQTTAGTGIFLQGTIIVEGELEIIKTSGEVIEQVGGNMIRTKLDHFAKN